MAERHPIRLPLSSLLSLVAVALFLACYAPLLYSPWTRVEAPLRVD